MGGLGSIPGWLLVPVAFVVLLTLRSVSLALGSSKPETAGAEKREVMRMAHAKSILSMTSETARDHRHVGLQDRAEQVTLRGDLSSR